MSKLAVWGHAGQRNTAAAFSFFGASCNEPQTAAIEEISPEELEDVVVPEHADEKHCAGESGELLPLKVSNNINLNMVPSMRNI